jgi:hypothetical protein
MIVDEDESQTLTTCGSTKVIMAEVTLPVESDIKPVSSNWFLTIAKKYYYINGSNSEK